MFPLLALIPGLFYTATKFIGSLIAEHTEVLTPVLERVLSNSPTGKKIVDAFESVVGKIDQDKKDAFTLELDSMLGQIDVDKIEASSPSFWSSGWRPFIAWGMGANLVLHYTLVNLIDIINSLFKTSISQIPQMDHMALTIICGLLGLYMGFRTHEKSKGIN